MCAAQRFLRAFLRTVSQLAKQPPLFLLGVPLFRHDNTAAAELYGHFGDLHLWCRVILVLLLRVSTLPWRFSSQRIGLVPCATITLLLRDLLAPDPSVFARDNFPVASYAYLT